MRPSPSSGSAGGNDRSSRSIAPPLECRDRRAHRRGRGDPAPRGADAGLPLGCRDVHGVGREARGRWPGRLLRARLFQRLPARVPVRAVAAGLHRSRRPAAFRGQGDQHPGRHRHRAPARAARAPPRGRGGGGPRGRDLDAAARDDLRRSVLGPGRRGWDTAVPRGPAGRRLPPLGDRRTVRGHRDHDQAAVRPCPRRHHRRRGRRAGSAPRPTAGAPRGGRRARCDDRPGAAFRHDAGCIHRTGTQCLRHLPVLIALCVQRLVHRLGFLERRQRLVHPGRDPARGRPVGLRRAALVAPRQCRAVRLCRRGGHGFLLSPYSRARALSLPGARPPPSVRGHAAGDPRAVPGPSRRVLRDPVFRVHPLLAERSAGAGVARRDAVRPEWPDRPGTRVHRDRGPAVLAARTRRGSLRSDPGARGRRGRAAPADRGR